MDHPAAITAPRDDRDKLVKFWIFGEKGVGKSALVQKFVVSHITAWILQLIIP